MAINLSDNIKVSAPKPVDSRYLNVTGGTYLNLSAVCASIPTGERYLGLTVLVKSGASNVEYWFKDNVNTLIEKKYDTVVPFSDYLTGASSMGDYVQCSGIQRLLLLGFAGGGGYDDNFYSENNNYFVDCSGFVRIGEYPHRGPVRRAYVNSARTWSWIFNAGTGTWIQTNYDITTRVSCSISCDYVSVYPNVIWGSYVSSGNTVCGYGSLSTGSTIIYGAPVYSCLENQDAHFRSIVSDTPNLLGVSYDENFVRLSGTSAILRGENIGTGEDVFAESISSGTTLYFKRLRGSGNTQVTAVGDSVVIFTSLSGGTTYITGATNIGSSGGTGVFDSRDNVTLQFRNLVGSGNTSISHVGDDVVIYTSGATEYYDLASPAICTVGGITGGTTLTGKTAFELFELMLVPVVNPTLTAPFVTTSLSVSGSYEVGTSISSLNVCSTYDAGCINPQYPPTACDKRSNGVVGYCFTSTGGQVDGYYTCSTSPAIQTIATYVVSAGTQTWGTCACACNGVQPYNNKGCPYCSPYVSGLTTVSPASITGIYPWFWGKTVSAPTINQALINSYTCKCCGSSTATIYVTNYNASGEYIWFATPAASTTKTKWQGCNNPSNNGTIPDSFMASVCTILINSPDGCGWTCNYKVYVSNYATAINYCMAFCN